MDMCPTGWIVGLLAGAMSGALWAAPPAAENNEVPVPSRSDQAANGKRQALKAALQGAGDSVAVTPIGLNAAARQQLRQQLKAQN
ncbi:hypothetical protein [Rhodoferax sp.]|uniref:hypothetical protein n=1 Tax=Rhodoferax sp. TaxID=50421 RepID=UPI0025FE47C9|nr:hypothetical protein [Rhodoferax sp.]